MKKFNSSSLMLCLCILTFVHFNYCSSGTATRTSTNRDETSVSSQSGLQSVNLKLNLSEGDTYYLSSTIEQSISMEMLGRYTDINTNIRIGHEFHVNDIQNDILSIRTTISDNAIKMDMSGGASSTILFDYDSRRQSNPDDIKNIFAIMIGESFTMKVSVTGKVLETTGTEEIMSKIIASSTLSVLPELQTIITGDLLRQGIGQMFNIYPDRPVSLGDTWSKNQTISMGIILEVLSNYTLISRKNGISSIGVKGTLKTLTGSTLVGMESVIVMMNMTGTSEGTINITEETGWIRDGSIIQNISGSMEVQNPNSPSQNVSIPMTMVLKTTFSSEKN